MSKSRKPINSELQNLWCKNYSMLKGLCGIKNVDLARICGVSKQSISNWLTDPQMDGVAFLMTYRATIMYIERNITSNHRYFKLIIGLLDEVETFLKENDGLF